MCFNFSRVFVRLDIFVSTLITRCIHLERSALTYFFLLPPIFMCDFAEHKDFSDVYVACLHGCLYLLSN